MTYPLDTFSFFATHGPRRTPRSRASRGFTLIELLVVLAIVAVLGVLATPRIREVLIEGKVDPTATDITKVVNAMRSAAAASGSQTPYTGLGATAVATANFANTARTTAVALTFGAGVGAAATVQHPLGATGSEITVASSTITVAGDSFTVTVPTVNSAACPNLATALNKQAEVITINGTSVKAAGGAYNSAAGPNLCTAGDTNTFTFTFR